MLLRCKVGLDHRGKAERTSIRSLPANTQACPAPASTSGTLPIAGSGPSCLHTTYALTIKIIKDAADNFCQSRPIMSHVCCWSERVKMLILRWHRTCGELEIAHVQLLQLPTGSAPPLDIAA